MKLVSIIVPVYNSKDTIERCINSILNQTYKEIELIIVNDGSTDNSLEIIKKLSKSNKKIKVINQENSGVSAARNNGINNSNGEYLSFVDSDDWLDKDFIREMVNKLEQENVDAVRCNFYKENVNSRELAKMYNFSDLKIEKSYKYKSDFLNHFLYNINSMENYVMLFLIKSSIVKNKISFDTNLYMMEDTFFVQQLFYNLNSIYFYNKPLYYYCAYNVSATRDIEKVEKNIYGILETSEKIKEFYEKKKIDINISKYNSSLINISFNYIIKYGKGYPLKKEIKLLKNIYDNTIFQKITNNYNYSQITKKRKILLRMLKSKMFCITSILIKIF